MARSVKEWQGASDDTPIPPRVRERVASRADHRCEDCGIRVRFGGEVDHVLAIILGGENRESNTQFLCVNCHKAKTREDVAAKAASYKKRIRHGPLKREQSAWSKRYHALKKWKAEREKESHHDG